MGPSDRLDIVARMSNVVCHQYTAGGLLVSRYNRLFLISDLASPRLSPAGSIPWGPKQWPAFIPWVDRALKAGVQSALAVDGRRFLLAAGTRWWSLGEGSAARDLGVLPVGRPMARGLCAAGGAVYVAEYRSNPRREPVRILRTTDVATFDEAWRFPARTVRHVHALVPDPFHAGRIWILTGDFDHESTLWYTDDRFESVHPFLNLGQRTRATDLICLRDRLVWGMDSPLETPHIMELPRTPGAVPEPVRRLDGPAYYTSRNEAGGCYIGTTVEPGPAVRDDFGRLYAWAPGQHWDEVGRWHHAPVPQYGILYLPRGVLPESFVVWSARALRPGDGQLVIARDRALDD